jgi:hypothetical protein
LTGRASFLITRNGKRTFPGTKLPAPMLRATVGPGTFSISPIVSDDERAFGAE